MSSYDDPPPPDPTAPPPTAPEPETAANRKWWIVAGAVVVAAIVVVIIILIVTGGDDDSGDVATGPAVEALQRDLTTLGHYDGPINGEYDAATQEAVKKLQTANGLPADGRLTPQTIAAIQQALGGQESQTMKAFQTTLSELGWYTGPIDGAYGPVTAEAVAGLQAQLGVTPDGILGPETFAAFESQCQPNPSPCREARDVADDRPRHHRSDSGPDCGLDVALLHDHHRLDHNHRRSDHNLPDHQHHHRLDDDVDRIAATSTPAGVTCVWGQSGRRKGPPGRQDGGGATSERPGQQLPRAGDAEHPHAHRLGGDPRSRGPPSTDRRRPGGPDRRPNPPHAGLPPPSRAAPPGHGPARLGRRRRRPAGARRRPSRHGSAQAVRSRPEHSPRPQPTVVAAAHGAQPGGRSHRAGREDAPRDRRRALRRGADGRTPRSRPHGRSTVARDCPGRRPRPDHRSPMANRSAAPGPWFASCARRPEVRSPGRPLAAELGRRSSRPAPSRSVHGTGQRDQRTSDGSTGRRVHLRLAR